MRPEKEKQNVVFIECHLMRIITIRYDSYVVFSTHLQILPGTGFGNVLSDNTLPFSLPFSKILCVTINPQVVL